LAARGRTPSRKRALARARGAGWRRKADAVIARLGEQIVAGKFASGQRLPTEAELVQKLKVSRPSLREALKALAAKGLVESRTRRGTIVLGRAHWDVLDPDVLGWMAASPDPEFLIGVLEARMIFEPGAARLAAQRATPAQILQIERAYQGMVSSLPHDVEACCQHDLAFHEGIIAAAGNVLLSRLASAIRTALLSVVRIGTDVRESYENSLAEHGAVAVAIRRRAPEEAANAMRVLLDGTARDIAPAVQMPRATPKTRKQPTPIRSALQEETT
jgi:DNA-binding FadR family transcriptional regulator